MKYLIINGSPRKENTWKIVNRCKEKLFKIDSEAEFDEINLIDENIPYCVGCYNCFTTGEETCPHRDYIEPLVNKMNCCDGLIIASPVYALNTTAMLKNLIDHLAYFYHRPAFFEKTAMVIVTTAGAGNKKVGDYLKNTLIYWGFNQIFSLCFVHAVDTHGYLPLKTKEKIDKESNMWYESIKNKTLKSPSMKALFRYNLWRAMASNNHIRLDNEYWKKNNMIDYEYYPSIPCNFVKKLPFKIFYKLMLGFMKKNTIKQE